MSKLEAEREALYNAYEDLRAFGVGEERWAGLERGVGSLNWVAADGEARNTMTVSAGSLAARLFGSIAVLSRLQEDREERTIFLFSPEIGKLMNVYRFVGDLTIQNARKTMLKQGIGSLILPRLRPSHEDYNALTAELQAGKMYYSAF